MIDIDTLVGRLMALETSFYELQSRYHSLINDYEQLKELHAGCTGHRDDNGQTNHPSVRHDEH